LFAVLGAEEQDPRGLFFADTFVGADRAVKELVGVEIYLKKRWTLGDVARDQRFRERIFDIALQSAT
jgi:hypothetical protein